MTTYGVDVQVETQTKRPLKIDTSPGGKISRTTRTNNTGNYGNNSSYRPPQSATQARRIDGSGNYGNPMRTHVNVAASEVPGSKHQTLGNRVRVASSNAGTGLGKAAKTAGKVAKTVGGKISPGVGINAKGDIDFGFRAGGFGVSASVKGDVSVSVPGASVTFNPRDPKGDNKTEIGFGVWDISSTRNGCSIIITTSYMGKVISQETRLADDCEEPEPTPEPTPTPTPKPNPSPNPPPDVPKSGSNTTVRPAKPGYRYKFWMRTDWKITGEIEGFQASRFSYYKYGDNIDDFLIAYEGDYIVEGFSYAYQDTVPVAIYDYMDNGVRVTRAEIGLTAGRVDDFFNSPEVYVPGASLYHYRWLHYYRGNTRLVAVETSGFTPAFSINSNPDHPGFISEYSDVFSLGIPVYWFADATITEIAEPPKPQLVLPRPFGNPRSIQPMEDEKCCELNKRIYEMLGGDDFFNKGISIPNSIYVPGGSGETQALTYHELNNLLFRTLAYRTPGNIEVKLKDSNIMKEGEQPLTYKATDATSYFNKLMEVTMSQDTDLSALINLIIRLNWIAVQILNISVKINQMSQSIIGFFGVPCKDTTVNVDIPVDPSLGQKVGFEAKKPTIDKIVKLLDLDDPTETRKLLDKFMNFARIPVTVKKLVSTAKGGNYWWLLDKNKR